MLKDVSTYREFNNQKKILEVNIESLEKENLRLREERLENERLKKLLNFTQGKDTKYIPSMVIGKDFLMAQDSIIIDKGKKHNIKKDMTVINGVALVGRVYEVGWSLSRVILITNKDMFVGGIVERTRDIGSVTGNGSSELIMRYLELGCDVKASDEVISSGFSGIFEKGMLIGKVVRVEKDPSGLYLFAIIKPQVDINKLEEVLVIKHVKP